MRTRLFIALLAVLAFAVMLPRTDAQAGVYGKISGTVEDANSGAVIVGATVRILGTSLTTTTDEDGEYFFLNVPIGKYDLVVTHVGFETITKKDVRILVDLTTPMDFAINQVTVELDEPTVVYASEPVIQRDLTASRVIFTADRLETLPNIVTVQAVLGNYPGVVVDREQEIHVRGGRSGQVSYYYDGFNVQDPFIADAGIRIMPSALEELSLTSGGFAAEYGEALSGVVNAVTPEGGAIYHGRIRAYEGLTHRYDVRSGDWGSLSRNDNRSLSFNISGPIPGLDGRHYSFFVAGEYLRNNTYLPHNWQTSYTGAMKLSAQPIPNLKLKTNFTVFDADGAEYEHRDVNSRSYDFNLDGLPVFEKRSYLIGLSGNYYFDERTIFAATLNRFSTRRLAAPEDLFDLHWDEWPGYSVDADGKYDGTIDDDNYLNDRDNSDPWQVYGFTPLGDFDPTYNYRETRYNSFSASMVKQVTKQHEVKTGFEWRRYEVFKDFRQFYNDQPYFELYQSNPVYSSFFLQDKIEYRDFVVNVGIRYDYRDADISYNVTPRDSSFADEIPRYKEADPKSRWSPRLGVSFPISVKTVMHFNYGLYYQMPRFTYLYFNPEGDIESGLPLLGNPDLSPEQTTSYELGVDHLVGDNLRFDITAYYKDIEDLVTARSYRSPAYQTTITQFYNEDFGSVKGFDVALEKLPGDDFFSASVSYGYMLANGNGSDALEPYYNLNTPDSVPPVTEYPLDFDQRHTITAVLKYQVPQQWTTNLFGLKVPGDWGLNMVGYFGSGLPYTKTDQFGNRLGERNEERLPAYYSVDMRFHKNLRLSRDRLLTWFVEVDNVFNRRNIINVYTRSGLPDNDYLNQGSGLALNEQDMEEANRLIDHDPQNYSPPRTIRTGLELKF